ncbi:MAG: hypothetical protein LBK94_09320 [Prevotellaceae bacterium]|nr:hypothetical protein [Prevotellaceae bacterium]
MQKLFRRKRIFDDNSSDSRTRRIFAFGKSEKSSDGKHRLVPVYDHVKVENKINIMKRKLNWQRSRLPENNIF